MKWSRGRKPSQLSPDELLAFDSQARPAARLWGAESADNGSYLGGNPVLGDSEWPTWDGRPLSFLASIDLSDLATIDVGIPLPDSGTLSFFYEAEEQLAWGFDPAHSDGWRVIFTPNSHTESVDPPDGALSFERVPLRIEPTLTFPGWEEPAIEALWKSNRKGVRARLEELERQGQPVAARHQLGGWPALQQGPFWLEAQLASHGINVGGPGGYKDPRAAALREGSANWRLLLQLDTDERAGWMWGDVGMLYFLMKEQDLAEGRFERAWMIFQCA